MLDDIKKTLWATANKLRAKVDAAEYKHMVLGLNFLKYISDTGGRQRVQNDVLGRYLVAMPPASIANEFGDGVTALQSKIAQNHQQAQTLTTICDTLLPRLISGQLRLPESQYFHTPPPLEEDCL